MSFSFTLASTRGGRSAKAWGTGDRRRRAAGPPNTSTTLKEQNYYKLERLSSLSKSVKVSE